MYRQYFIIVMANPLTVGVRWWNTGTGGDAAKNYVHKKLSEIE